MKNFRNKKSEELKVTPVYNNDDTLNKLIGWVQEDYRPFTPMDGMYSVANIIGYTANPSLIAGAKLAKKGESDKLIRPLIYDIYDTVDIVNNTINYKAVIQAIRLAILRGCKNAVETIKYEFEWIDPSIFDKRRADFSELTYRLASRFSLYVNFNNIMKACIAVYGNSDMFNLYTKAMKGEKDAVVEYVARVMAYAIPGLSAFTKLCTIEFLDLLYDVIYESVLFDLNDSDFEVICANLEPVVTDFSRYIYECVGDTIGKIITVSNNYTPLYTSIDIGDNDNESMEF